MEKAILHVVEYFSIFSYPPTKEEVYLFLNKKTSKREFLKTITYLISGKKLYYQQNRLALKRNLFKVFAVRKLISKQYWNEGVVYLSLLKYLPSIQYVGISGSLSMLNTSEKGDIDVFIITSNNTIWTTRFIVLIYKKVLRFVNKNIPPKLCFNMFFSEKGLIIPFKKQNEYIGHELLQLKTIVDKHYVYKQFLSKNKWLCELFPNAPKYKLDLDYFDKIKNMSKLPTFIELLFKLAQVWWFDRKGITWKEENNQLWLIENDFEKKIEKEIGITKFWYNR